ncbi:MAG TPA: hypothetical protein VFO19_17000 [Vicinamibacterales bacterium]|nr:hypothetical protein [Vicinamibacterales bacterium]
MTAAEVADRIAVAPEVPRALDELGIASTVGGSIASSYAGEPRSTIDIDIVAAIEERHVADVAAALSDRFYVDEDALRRAARDVWLYSRHDVLEYWVTDPVKRRVRVYRRRARRLVKIRELPSRRITSLTTPLIPGIAADRQNLRDLTLENRRHRIRRHRH